jgi:SH3-like domain-containing protein
MRGWFVATLMVVMVLAPVAAGAADSTSRSLPLPRFVSLKSDKVNVRNGPTKDHDVTWSYTRAGLPVEIVAEFENWRRIRDWEGSEGWVYHSLLSGRRTATVTARSKEMTEVLPVFDKPEGALTAKLQPGVLGSVKRCNGHWCRLSGDGFDGWVSQERLWGVYPNERIE